MWSKTPSMAAMANMDMAMTLRPSIASLCASMKLRPEMRRIMAAASAQPAIIKNSLNPKFEWGGESGP